MAAFKLVSPREKFIPKVETPILWRRLAASVDQSKNFETAFGRFKAFCAFSHSARFKVLCALCCPFCLTRHYAHETDVNRSPGAIAPVFAVRAPSQKSVASAKERAEH